MGISAFRRREDEVLWRELEQELVLLDLRSSTYMSLNRTGAILWEALEEACTPEALTAVLVDTYGVTDGQASADVRAFLDTLADSNLLVAC